MIPCDDVNFHYVKTENVEGVLAIKNGLLTVYNVKIIITNVVCSYKSIEIE